MTHLQRIEGHLATRPRLCDDCLASELQIHPRQTVNGVCARSPSIQHAREACVACGKVKILRLLADGSLPVPPPLVRPTPSEAARRATSGKNAVRYVREEDLRTKFNLSISTTLGIVSEDYYSRLSFDQLLELKAGYARIHDIITLKLTLALAGWVANRFSLAPDEEEKLRQSISILHPNASGFDLDCPHPNIIAEVKGNIPVNAGSSFGAAQVKGLTNDVLQMMGRPPLGKLEDTLSERAKILRPNRAQAFKFLGLYDSPKVRAAARSWMQTFVKQCAAKSLGSFTIAEVPEIGQLLPDTVYLVYLKATAA